MYHVPCRDPVRLTGWERGDKKIGAARLSSGRKDSRRGVQSGKGNSAASLCSLEPGHSMRLRSDSTHQSFPPENHGGSATQFLGTSPYVDVRYAWPIPDLVDSLVGFSIFEYGHDVVC